MANIWMGHGPPGPPGESSLDMYKVNHSTTVMYTHACMVLQRIYSHVFLYTYKCVIYTIYIHTWLESKCQSAISRSFIELIMLYETTSDMQCTILFNVDLHS